MNSVSAKEVFHEPIFGRVTLENRKSNKTKQQEDHCFKN